jgi:trk/ktr system potassium uptake protein
LIKSVFLFTAVIGGAGFILLFFRFFQGEPLSKALFSGLFHSTSAFCNAGFSIYSDSLMRSRGDILVNLAVAHLIIFGGLGFLAFGEARTLYVPRADFIIKDSDVLIVMGDEKMLEKMTAS